MSTRPLAGYEYTRLADWSTPSYGITAFGIATPQGAVPTNGLATFNGVISGWADTFVADQADYALTSVAGTIRLDFDFGAGALSGQIHPELSSPRNSSPDYHFDLGPYAFSNTVYSAGSTTFSGQFDTATAGANSFDGQFTGPGAEELMGKWVLPFIWSDPGNGDDQVHSASGVFIGRKD
jgi:hypothetical protein